MARKPETFEYAPFQGGHPDGAISNLPGKKAQMEESLAALVAVFVFFRGQRLRRVVLRRWIPQALVRRLEALAVHRFGNDLASAPSFKQRCHETGGDFFMLELEIKDSSYSLPITWRLSGNVNVDPTEPNLFRSCGQMVRINHAPDGMETT